MIIIPLQHHARRAARRSKEKSCALALPLLPFLVIAALARKAAGRAR